jgi:glycogen phosphorylase
MNKAAQADARPSTGSDDRSDLLKQYGCGPIRFSGTDDGLYERHLLFDDVVIPESAGPHERLSGGCALGQGCPFATLGSH